MTDIDASTLPLADWTPQSRIRVHATDIRRPALAAIDIHNHLGRWLSADGTWIIDNVEALLRTMDECGVDAIVNLDGRWGEELKANLDRYDRAHPGRFLTFCHVDWSLLGSSDGVDRLTASLDDSAAQGARGVKVWKDLGLTVRDAAGTLVRPDDDRVIRVLQHAGTLGLPVLIHTGDPLAFFDPLDATNERLDELSGRPDWWFGDRNRYPSFGELFQALTTVVVSCPGTRFIGAHVGCLAEDLDAVSSLLDRAPNFWVDIAGRLAEIGRQPRRFRKLVEDHPSRVLFGTDAYPATAKDYGVHYRFLETADESFGYDPSGGIPGQGRWDISAADLPRDLLAAVYRENALSVLFP